MSSLYRLIALAQKTGDRLIVHDKENATDVVIMDIDSYEHLLFDRGSMRPKSEAELLDQINRDIAIWRATSREEEEICEDIDMDEPWRSVGKRPSADFFDDTDDLGIDEEPWQTAGGIIGNRYADLKSEVVKDAEKEADEAKIEALTNQLSTIKNIIDHKTDESEGEPLSEEPIFYDEPVV